ncbi:MAG: cell division protein SepF [Oscillospiraceae bacterium]
MKLINNLHNMFVGADESGEDYEAAYSRPDADDRQEPVRRPRETRISSGGADSATFQIVLARPVDFTEVKPIGDEVNMGKTVLLNLEEVKGEDARRILDFLSGVAHANGADMKMMAAKTFAIMPKNVGFSGVDIKEELENNGYSF